MMDLIIRLAKQPNKRTIQEEIEKNLNKICGNKNLSIEASEEPMQECMLNVKWLILILITHWILHQLKKFKLLIER